MSPLRASAYTPYHVAEVGRIRLAIVTAAARLWDANCNETDCMVAIQRAVEDGDDALVEMLGYALSSAQTYREYMHRDLLTLVSTQPPPHVWPGVAGGYDVLVTWYPELWVVEVNCTK